MTHQEDVLSRGCINSARNTRENKRITKRNHYEQAILRGTEFITFKKSRNESHKKSWRDEEIICPYRTSCCACN